MHLGARERLILRSFCGTCCEPSSPALQNHANQAAHLQGRQLTPNSTFYESSKISSQLAHSGMKAGSIKCLHFHGDTPTAILVGSRDTKRQTDYSSSFSDPLYNNAKLSGVTRPNYSACTALVHGL